MESQYLQHWGIRGMKWGVRRFQNKDGTLTPAGKKRYSDAEGTAGETTEQKRARLLNSTDAKELYENRSLLTTNELNERINRIDTEARLQSKIKEEPKPTVKSVVDKIVSVGNSINSVYEMTQKPVFKALSKALGFTPPEKPFSWDEASGKLNKMSTEEIQKLAKRAANEKIVRNYMDELNKKAAEKSSSDSKSDSKTDKASPDDSKSDSKTDKTTTDTKSGGADDGSYRVTGDRVVDSTWTKSKAEKGADFVEGSKILDKDGTPMYVYESGKWKDDVDTGRNYVKNIFGLLEVDD